MHQKCVAIVEKEYINDIRLQRLWLKKLSMKRYGDELYMNMLFVLAYAFIYTSLGLGFPYINGPVLSWYI
jgi:hypothetical protein